MITLLAIGLAFAHVAGFMAYLIFIPDMAARSKLLLAFFWEFVAMWDFLYPIYEDFTHVDR